MIPSFNRITTTSGINDQLGNKINVSEKGAVNGVCPLDSSGLINPSYYDPSVMQFIGVWDATANLPALNDGVGNRGDLYIVSVGGSNFTPSIEFVAGEYVVYDGAKWRRVSSVSASNPTFTTINVTDKVTTLANLVVYNKPEIMELPKLALNCFSCFYKPVVSSGAATINMNSNILSLASSRVLDLNIMHASYRQYDVASYVNNVSTGYLYVYAWSNPLSGQNLIKLNSYRITGRLSTNVGDSYSQHSITSISAPNTYTEDERLIVCIIESPIATTVSTNDGYLEVIGTSTNPIVNLTANTRQQVGAYKPFQYVFNSPTSNGGHISANSSLVASATQMTIGHLPSNRGLIDANYIPTLFNLFKAKYPFKLIVLNYATGERATMSINSFLGSGADSETFSVSYVVAETTMTNFPVNGTGIMVFFDKFIYSQGGEITTNNNGNYITATNTQTNLNSLDSQLLTTNNNLNTQQSQILRMHKNILSECSLISLRLSSPQVPTSVTYNSFGSMTIIYSSLSAWDSMQCIILRNQIPQARYNSPRPFFAIQLSGSNWSAIDTSAHLLMGYCPLQALSQLEQWATSDFILGFQGVWNVNPTDVAKVIRVRFGSTTSLWNYGAINILGVDTPPSPSMTTTQNDIMIFYFNETTMKYTIEWRNSLSSYSIKCSATFDHVDGITNLINNTSSIPLVPIFSTLEKGPNWDIKILSERELTSLGVTVSGGECMFY